MNGSNCDSSTYYDGCRPTRASSGTLRQQASLAVSAPLKLNVERPLFQCLVFAFGSAEHLSDSGRRSVEISGRFRQDIAGCLKSSSGHGLDDDFILADGLTQ